MLVEPRLCLSISSFGSKITLGEESGGWSSVILSLFCVLLLSSHSICVLWLFFAGNYICELETYGEPIDQTNKLDVLGKSSPYTHFRSLDHFSFFVPCFSAAVHLHPERQQEVVGAQGLDRVLGLQRVRLSSAQDHVATRGRCGCGLSSIHP